MKAIFFATLIFFFISSSAQYYYKDIIGTKESAELLTNYGNNKVQSVTLKTYTVNNTPLDNFLVRQEFLPAQRALRTTTKSEFSNPSYLTSYTDASGRVIKTTDSSEGMVNTSIYSYNNAGKLASILITNGDSLVATQTDEHLWQYDAQGRISRLLRIKNKNDTAYIVFKLDAAGNVIEEQETHYGIKPEPFLYYYDDKNRLTDIVRYNKKAARLLPEYMFEYSAANQVIQRYTIPQNSSQYLIWRYQYNDKGLKTKEAIYNKQKELTGKVEYQYTFAN
jgi:hypothetical protein